MLNVHIAGLRWLPLRGLSPRFNPEVSQRLLVGKDLEQVRAAGWLPGRGQLEPFF